MSIPTLITVLYVIIGLLTTQGGVVLLYMIFSGKIKLEKTRSGSRSYASTLVLAFGMTIGGIAWIIWTFVDPYWVK